MNMMRKRISLLWSLMLFFSLNSIAQFENHDPQKLTADEHLRLADRYYAESIFYDAAENYKAYLEKHDNNRYAIFWLAMSLYEARDYKESADFFKKFYETDAKDEKQQKQFDNENKTAYKLGHLYYAMVLQRLANYDKAKSEIKKFKADYTSNNETEYNNTIALANRIAKACDDAPTIKKAKARVKKVTALSTAYNEGAPFGLNEDIIYYHSLNQNQPQEFKYYKNDFHTTIYQSSKNEKGEWERTGKIVNVGVNDPKYWVGNGTFNADRSRFYFTKCLEMDDDRSLCNIFECEMKAGKLSEPKRLPEGINFEYKYTTTHPAVRTKNSKEEILYFSSSMPGGVGGMDIWYVVRDKNGNYSAPKLMGNGVNTVADEVTPFFNDSTKTLYFSSDGHSGFGGFDVFAVNINPDAPDSIAGVIRNMGMPINSGADDLYYSINNIQNGGFFVSNRKGSKPLKGIATASDDIFEWENFKYGVEGDVKITGNDIANVGNVKYNLYRVKEDGSRELVGIDSTSKNKKYFFKLNPDEDYQVEIESPGFISVAETITTKGLDDEDTLYQAFKVNKDAYLLVGKVYDEAKPDGYLEEALVQVIDITNGNEMMLKEVQMKPGEKEFVVSVPTERDYKLMGRKEGFFAGSNRVSTKNIGNLADSIRVNIGLKKMELNKEYKLDNILYDFAKATLRPESKLILDSLYTILVENPTMKIELSSHTDAIGSDAANQKLSQARAKSCVDYLISKGIAADRMIPTGYGETKPIAPNTKEDGSDNPEGRALNRRTEFKILKI